MTWLSIDGGNEKKTDRACYVARWDARQLVWVARASLSDLTDWRETPSHVAVERHQQDGRIAGGGGKVPPGVIIDLAWNTAAVAYTLARGAPVHEYTPAVWIGSINKAALQQRIWAALTTEERKVVAAFARAQPEDVSAALRQNLIRQATGKPLLKHNWYNVLDAVGVGLFHIGRIGKGAAPVRKAR